MNLKLKKFRFPKFIAEMDNFSPELKKVRHFTPDEILNFSKNAYI